MVILRHPAVGDVVLACRILFGEVADIFFPMLIFLIAPAGKKNIAIPRSENSPLVLQRSGENEK
jgi:hypothetical protein